jgi:hypothetical protein
LAAIKNPMRRYHYRVHMPDNLGEMLLEFMGQLKGDPNPTNHAAEQMLNDKRGIIPLPTKAELFNNNNTLVEAYEILENGQPTGRIQKLVIRVPTLSEKYDHTYVIARENFILTNWKNDKGDEHRLTEAIENYYQPEKKKNKNDRISAQPVRRNSGSS